MMVAKEYMMVGDMFVVVDDNTSYDDRSDWW